MPDSITECIASLDWNLLQQSLDEHGYALIPPLLDKDQCREIINMYDEESFFRSTIDMTRYRFGRGEYKYFQSPLPSLLQELRTSFYPELAKTANRWLQQLGRDAIYPSDLEEFLDHCHQQGQVRSTPLILKYETVSA
jgi:uncharacterized protein